MSEEDMIVADQGGGQGFTNVDPATRRIVPDAKGRAVVKVVYVVLEAQYQSALSAAVNSLNATNDKVCFEVSGYLLEELRDAKNQAMLKEDVESANIFIGSLIFIEELAEKIVDIVTPLRDSLDACLIFPSMPAVMRLNKLGTFSMAQLGQSKSAIASFMKKKKSGGFEEGMLKLVRTLPKVLKYLPSDKAQDARNFMNSLQYWLGGSSDNLENFLLMISKAYVPALENMDMEIAEPETVAETGIWHPMAPYMYEDLKEYLNWYDTRKDITFAKDAPVVGPRAPALPPRHRRRGPLRRHGDGARGEAAPRWCPSSPAGWTFPSPSRGSSSTPSPRTRTSTPCCRSPASRWSAAPRARTTPRPSTRSRSSTCPTW